MSQLDENINKFMMIKDRAKKLIQMDNNGSIDKIKHQAISEGKLSYDSDGMVSAQIKQDNNMSQYNALPNNFKTKSKLPTEILESFKSNPISCGDLPTNSVLDLINEGTDKTLFKEETKIEEPKPVVSQQQIIPTATNIDYSMIKMIVEDCLRKQLASIKKTILTESTNKNNDTSTLKAMKIGNKFSFVTDNGDLYEAKLTFIKNINKKSGN